MNKGLYIEPLMTERESLLLVTEEERCAASAFGAARRQDYFAWRALVRRELGNVRIGYNEVGAPVLPDLPGTHIGVSHGAGHVALTISDRPCAVDIESIDRNFNRILSRYLTSSERALCSDPYFAAVAWCAKETLYKLSAEQGLDFLADLRITAVGNDWIEGCIKKGAARRLSVRYMEGAVVVWLL